MATYWVDPYINAPINGTAGAAGTTARGTSGSYATPWDWIDIFGEYFPGTTDQWGTHLAPGDEIRFKGFASSDFYPIGNAKSWNPTTFTSYTNANNNVTYRYYFNNSSITQYLPLKTANKDGTVRHFNPVRTTFLRAGISTTWDAASFQLDPNGYTEFDTNYMINASTYFSSRSGNQINNGSHYLFGNTDFSQVTPTNWATHGQNNGHSGEFVKITAGWDSENTQNGQTHIVFDQSYSFGGSFYLPMFSQGIQISDKVVWSAPEFYFYSPNQNAYCYLSGLSIHIGGWISQNNVSSTSNEVRSGPYNNSWDSYGTTPTLPGTQQIGDIKMNEWVFGSYSKWYMNPNNNTATLDIPEINHGYYNVQVFTTRRNRHNGNTPSNQGLKASDLNCKWHIKLKRFMSNYHMQLERTDFQYFSDEAVIDFTFDNDWFIRQGVKFTGTDWILGTETIGTQAPTTETTAGIIQLYSSGNNALNYLSEPSNRGIGSTDVANNKMYSNNTSVFKQLNLGNSSTPYYGNTNYFFSEWIIDNGENINNVSTSPMNWSDSSYRYSTVETIQDKTTNGTQRIYRNSPSAYVMNEPISGRSVTIMGPVDDNGPSAAYYKSSDFSNNYTFKLWGSSNGRYYCKGFEIPLWDYSTGSDKTLSTTFTTSTSPGIDAWIQIIGFSPLADPNGIYSFYLYEIPATVSGTSLTFNQVISNELLKANLITRLEGKILLKKTSSSTGHVATPDITVT